VRHSSVDDDGGWDARSASPPVLVVSPPLLSRPAPIRDEKKLVSRPAPRSPGFRPDDSVRVKIAPMGSQRTTKDYTGSAKRRTKTSTVRTIGLGSKAVKNRRSQNQNGLGVPCTENHSRTFRFAPFENPNELTDTDCCLLPTISIYPQKKKTSK
jgi:hypothetical protein